MPRPVSKLEMPMGEPEYVTMDMVKTLLQNQADAFNSSFKLLIQDLKEDMKSIRKETTDVQVSLQFSQAKMEANEKKIQLVENSIAMHSENLHDINHHADQVESQLEYLENQSRRSNVRITGVTENKDSEKSWDDTEKVVKKIIKEKLNITEDIEIERCHRVNRRNNSYRKPNQVDQPRPIVAKFSKWKDKERVLSTARQLRPEGVRFLADLSRRTLDKREAQVPMLLDARKKGKVAYFVLDKLVIKDKPFNQSRPPSRPASQGERSTNDNSDHEVSFG